ncbi:MAG: type IV secretion system DNA-binding domain-containing protein [Bacteroidota bacterium]|nr:type IV secretion system DNA-binding domain-containing protein [Bacteroidota bacterium]
MNNEINYQNEITPLGKVNFRSDNREFGIKDKDRLYHIWAIGKTGTGKSTLLQNMAISDIQKGKGCAIIDPHGEIADNILKYIPHDRIEDVIYFNPTDMEFPIAFNPLKNVHPEYHHLVASGLLSTFQKLWLDNWGPRLSHILKHSLLTLLEYRESSLLDIQPLLTDIEYRHKVLSRIKSQYLLAFWYNEFDKYSNAFRAEAIAPILNKLGLFSSSVPIRNIVGQKKRGFQFQKIMEGKIFIANLSKGIIGEDASILLGCMLLTSFQLAALYRASQPEHTRKPFYLYVDEAHSYMTTSFVDILSEARKYGLSLFLTHQYVEQLKPEIRSAVMGNAGTIISFRIGPNDARYLAEEFYPVFNHHDMINLPRYCMYLKLMIDNEASQPFSATSLPLMVKEKSFRREIIEHSRKQYGKPRREVEKIVYTVEPQQTQQTLFQSSII